MTHSKNLTYKKNLFLFFEGLATNVIDSQVLTHCKNMKKIGVEFEIWAFACNDELYKNSLERIEYAQELSECEVKVFKGIRPAYPFSERLNTSIVKNNIKKYNIQFDLIHARTDYSAHVASQVTDDFIWDCRGDALAEFNGQYRDSYNILFKTYKRWKIFNNIRRAMLSKKALFVSHFLHEKYQYKRESYVVGCAADSNMFFYDTKLRTNTRKVLNILDGEKVLIYSGGMAHYQLFPQIVELFSRLGNDWKFIVLTTSLDMAHNSLSDIPKDRYILKSVKLDEVNDYLNAADVGVILREQDDLNRAASPTKYAEYCMSGLSIIYSSGIGDLDTYNKKLNNEVEENDLDCFQHDEILRGNISSNATNLLSKDSILDSYKRLYLGMEQ